MHRIFNTQTGFTLVETLVALVVFATGMLGLSGLSTVVFYNNRLSQQITLAATLAHEQAEALEGMRYEAVQSQSETLTAANQGRYRRTTTVTPNTPAPGMKTVTITVTWLDQARHRGVTLNTLVIRE